MNGVAVVFAIIGGLGGLTGLGALISSVDQRRKIKAEANKLGVDAGAVISGEALEMYRLARSEAQEAKAEAKACSDELRAVRGHVTKLEDLMRAADIEPPPFLWPLHQIGGAS